MKPVVLELRHAPSSRVDASALISEWQEGASLAEIEKIPLRDGCRALNVGDLFRVMQGSESLLRIHGDLKQVDGLASKLRRGHVEIHGAVGDLLAIEMTGGEVVVHGDAGRLCAANLRGGSVKVYGSVGDDGGGALRGQVTGMRGGQLHIYGNAGARLGHRLRRGTIYVRGCTAERCGLSMVAGTIIAEAGFGAEFGYGMRRGTLLSWSAINIAPSSTRFSSPEVHDLGILRLLLHGLPDLQRSVEAKSSHPTRVLRQIGDLSERGRGEVLMFMDR